MTDDDGIFAHKVVDELVQVGYIVSISIGHGLQKRMKVCTVLFPTPAGPITLKSKKNESMFLEKRLIATTHRTTMSFSVPLIKASLHLICFVHFPILL